MWTKSCLLLLSTLWAHIPQLRSLSCFSCEFDFNDAFDGADGWCANDTLLDKPSGLVIRPCAPWENQCMTTIKTTQNSFTSIVRGCAVHCPDLCDSDGYGPNQVTCALCCKSDNCNNGTGVTYYLSIMEKQYTYWTKALSGEKKFNKVKGLKFPY